MGNQNRSRNFEKGGGAGKQFLAAQGIVHKLLITVYTFGGDIEIGTTKYVLARIISKLF